MSEQDKKTEFPENLFVMNVREPLVRDVLERKWLEWWDQANDVEVNNSDDTCTVKRSTIP